MKKIGNYGKMDCRLMKERLHKYFSASNLTQRRNVLPKLFSAWIVLMSKPHKNQMTWMENRWNHQSLIRKSVKKHRSKYFALRKLRGRIRKKTIKIRGKRWWNSEDILMKLITRSPWVTFKINKTTDGNLRIELV